MNKRYVAVALLPWFVLPLVWLAWPRGASSAPAHDLPPIPMVAVDADRQIYRARFETDRVTCYWARMTGQGGAAIACLPDAYAGAAWDSSGSAWTYTRGTTP